MKDRRPTAIDLFCGAGGMSLGFEQAGVNVAAAFDLEKFNVDTHNLNFPETQAFAVDLSKQTGDSLRKMAGLNRTEIDIVFGGPPCQGFSVGGLQDVEDKRNLLLYDFARLVKEIGPKYFVMENVKGLMSQRSRPILESFIRRVKRAGYSIVEPIRVLNAADYGVPQRRWRTIILGYQRGLVAPQYPEKRGCLVSQGQQFFPVVKDAIEDLPRVEKFKKYFEDDVFRGKLRKTLNPYALLMRSINSDQSRANRFLTGCLRTIHTPETIKRFSRTPQGGAEPISRYFRLAWDEVAPTIRAGTGADHGSHTAPRPIHPDSPRCITAREAARLHSFPDWFQFHGTRWHDFRQIGNSVPPHLAKAIATELMASA